MASLFTSIFDRRFIALFITECAGEPILVRKNGIIPYLEMLVRAFNQQPVTQPTHRESAPSPRPSQPLLDPLSAREQDVLRLLARGAANQDIGSHPAPLSTTSVISSANSRVTDRTQAVARARALGLLSSDSLD